MADSTLSPSALNRYRNILLESVGIAIHKAKKDGEAPIAAALIRWQSSTEFSKDAPRCSLHAYTAGMDERQRRKFHDIITTARAQAEASVRYANVK